MDNVECYTQMETCIIYFLIRFECNFDNGKANGFGYFQSKSKIVKGINFIYYKKIGIWRDNLL